MAFKFSRTSNERKATVHADLQRVLDEALRRSPIDFGITEGHRTTERQQELFAIGRELRDGKWVEVSRRVTNCDGVEKKSKHQSGEAVDLYAFVNGKASFDQAHLALVAGVVLSTAKDMGVDIRWGGTFGSKDLKGWDYPHFELRG